MRCNSALGDTSAITTTQSLRKNNNLSFSRDESLIIVNTIRHWANKLIQPKSEDPHDAFRERIIRIIVVVALTFFTLLTIMQTIRGVPNDIHWLVLTITLGIFELTALHYGKVGLAGRILIFSVIIVPTDPTASYWGAGTIILSLMLTLMFQLTLRTRTEIFVAVGLNLLAYTYIAITTEPTDILPPNDFFSDPLTATLSVYIAHFFIIAISQIIHYDRNRQHHMELLAEQYQADVLRQFLSDVSHDLNTPITNIKTQLYVLERKTNEDNQPHITRMKESVDKLNTMVSSMLEMVRLEEINQFTLRNLDVDHVVQDVITLHSKPTITIEYQTSTVQPTTIGDKVYLRRAISNVLENAVAVTPDSGKIDIRLIEKPQEEIIISIKDYGKGIPSELIPHIFERFFRIDDARSQSNGHNGLGLAIAKRIIELHGGKIDVQSTVGEGTEFTIHLPHKR